MTTTQLPYKITYHDERRITLKTGASGAGMLLFNNEETISIPRDHISGIEWHAAMIGRGYFVVLTTNGNSYRIYTSKSLKAKTQAILTWREGDPFPENIPSATPGARPEAVHPRPVRLRPPTPAEMRERTAAWNSQFNQPK